MDTIREQRGSIIGILIPAILILMVIVGPLLLHFGQRRHDVLPFDVKTAYTNHVLDPSIKMIDVKEP